MLAKKRCLNAVLVGSTRQNEIGFSLITDLFYIIDKKNLYAIYDTFYARGRSSDKITNVLDIAIKGLKNES